jgi:nicotinate-nucleotide pyrophosphorylase (carboxylating)
MINKLKSPDRLINELIELAISEDIGDGDHTSMACVSSDRQGQCRLLVKDEGVLAGVRIARKIFTRFNPRLQVKILIEDGSWVRPGDVAFTVSGSTRSMLESERIVLNVMQRMSGVATVTQSYVRAIEGTRALVLDTRKTTPGMRILEKEAVRIGGGANHRTGLYDMILIKDNHIDFAGGITKAVTLARYYMKHNGKPLRVEIEVRSMDELHQALRAGSIDRVMLDNFSLEDTREAVDLIGGRLETESSGGITLETIRSYAECGVNYISVGALTHSVKSLDMSLKAI